MEKIGAIVEAVTNKVLEGIDKGIMPWEYPWFVGGSVARNRFTARPYRGMNVWILGYEMEEKGYQFNQWLTYNQATHNGGHVKKGEKGTLVYFFGRTPVKDKENPGKTKLIFTPRVWTVFNVSQCEGITGLEAKKAQHENNETGDLIITKSGADIRYNEADTFAPAFYSPSADYIGLPKKELFKTAEGFYSTAFHELGHWTKHKDRTNRAEKGLSYSFEELVAELTGAFLASFVGFAYDTQHTAYIQNWAKELKDKKDGLAKAASMASRASEFLLKKAGLVEEVKEEAEKVA